MSPFEQPMGIPLPTSRDEPMSEAFVQLLTAEQLKLLHYIARLLGNPNEAQNVLQETNLVLWRKSNDYCHGTNFSAWARNVAYWQVRAYVRDRQRDRHVFNEELVQQLAKRDEDEVFEPEMRIALRHCLAEMSSSNLDMLRQRYEGGLTIQDLAVNVGKSPTSVKVGLLRMRRALLKCIERKIAGF